MDDLSHWIYAREFTIDDAAYLIMGIDPSHSNKNTRSAEHIKARMFADYYRAIAYFDYNFFVVPSKGEYDDKDLVNKKFGDVDTMLFSTVLLWNLENCSEGADDIGIKEWLKGARKGPEYDRFSRAHIARWIEVNKLNTKYQFSQEEMPVGSQSHIDKYHPIRTTEKNVLLLIIAVLCDEAKYDHRRHAKTAGLIKKKADEMGLSIGESTIENHLKKIPDALETRMK